MSADEELGYVYLPVSTPTNDFYGGHRPGDGLYGESLVCLDATTGKIVWHYQLVHHGLWDYDTPAAPNLIDITVGGRPIKAVAQVTKQAFVYVFDRVTGEPVWPIEEQPVPASNVPGERASKTQPFPSKPAPIDIQGVRDEDLIDLTPEIHKQAIDIVAPYDHGPLFTRRRSAAPSRCPALPAAAVGPERRSIRRPARFMPGRFGCPSSSPSASLMLANRHTISSVSSAICRARRGCRCSSRHSAASSPST
jgi:hypothetical protein